MSLAFSASIGRYAEDMGTYCENIQHWLDVASADLTARQQLDRRDKILGIDSSAAVEFFAAANTVHQTDEMDRQLAVLALAIAGGTRFEYPNGKHANGWIMYMLRGFTGTFELDLREYLTPIEILYLGDLRLL
jgi:hypothetical protein